VACSMVLRVGVIRHMGEKIMFWWNGFVRGGLSREIGRNPKSPHQPPIVCSVLL
jgi:hypothetical protein